MRGFSWTQQSLCFHLLCENYCTANNSAFVQLVYKVKLDFVLEQLASASVGGYGQDVWSELVEEAKTNLMKITVSVTLFLFFQKKHKSRTIGGLLEVIIDI